MVGELIGRAGQLQDEVVIGKIDIASDIPAPHPDHRSRQTKA
jgi:hypothetical protein